MQRYNPLFEMVRTLIANQLLGELLHGYFENYASDENLPAEHWFWDRAKSGGIFIEHGVHFFDMLMWIFGDVKENIVTQHSAETASGHLELENASVDWSLSIDAKSLPEDIRASGKRTFRTLNIDGDSFEFSDGFTELHTQSYAEIIAGRGFPISETRKAIDLVHQIRNYKI